VDVVFEQRLQTNDEDLRKQLLAVPELRLFSDLIVQKFREAERKDESMVKGLLKIKSIGGRLHAYRETAAEWDVGITLGAFRVESTCD
jgi:sortase (surface protein transpeptidase)